MAGLFQRLMDFNLRGAVTAGRFRVIWPDGSETVYGDGAGPHAGVHITTDATLRRVAMDPALAIGEGYMDGSLIPVGCTHHDLLALLMRSIEGKRVPIIEIHDFIGRLVRRIAQANNARRSKANVAHHYDLSGELYSLFLDQDRQYSCAYFADDSVSLEEAQAAKKRHIAAKLLLDRPGLEVLDIGCGWGGMAITLAREFGARVTGITLSEEQLGVARARAAAAGVADRVTFELIDYRNMNRSFDRIVSVGMFEHVGVPNFRTFFETVKRCLKEDGVALIHSIGRMAGPGATNPWMAKYIFPGGYSPALSEVLGPVERAGLITADVEILRLHYAKTLAHWRRRFAANRDKIAALYDERFCRMFEFYLSASQLTFEVADHMNFQIQLVQNRHALPLTRDYMFEQEREVSFSAAAE